jgi:hypothetical protein
MAYHREGKAPNRLVVDRGYKDPLGELACIAVAEASSIWLYDGEQGRTSIYRVQQEDILLQLHRLRCRF